MTEKKIDPDLHSSSFPSIFSFINNKPYSNDKVQVFNDFKLNIITYPQPNDTTITQAELTEKLPEYDSILHAINKCKEIASNDKSVNPYLLVSGDLSGIQDTVFTISSKGALKSLRARSFMLEFLCEHICYEIVTNVFNNHYKKYQNHVIYTGGGGFCLLLPNGSGTKKTIDKIKIIINDWAFREFGGKLYVAIACEELNEDEIKIGVDNVKFKNKWNILSDQLEIEKKQKFSWKLNEIFSDTFVKEPTLRNNNQECQICHRDDIDFPKEPLRTFSGKLLNDSQKLEKAELNSDDPIVHELCYQLINLGDRLTKAKYISSVKVPPKDDGYLSFPSLINGTVYYEVKVNENSAECTWTINSTEANVLPLYYANYVTKVEDLPATIKEIEMSENSDVKDFHTASFNALANSSRGASLIACLRMDVDDMGKVLTEDLEVFNLVTLANFSKMMNLFFKVYLPLICSGNLGSSVQPTNITSKNYSQGRKVSIVYSGGDDLFIVGAWDETSELAYDIQKCFKEYSGLGISAGLTLHKSNFPLYQMAKQSAEALNESKSFKKYLDFLPTKNKFALFYKYSRKERNEALLHIANTNINNGKHDYRDKLNYCTAWDDNLTIDIVTKFQKMCIEENNRMKLQVISRAFFRKLFAVIEVWWTRNIMYVPDLLRLFDERINRLNKNQNFQNNLRNLRDLLVQMPLKKNSHEGIKSLSIPLTWIELLIRDKGE